MTQKNIILNSLLKGKFLSKLDILDLAGCINAGERIRELRNDGHDIRVQWREGNGKRWAAYYIVAPGVRRVF
jgi:hypothetical protein